MIAGRLPGSHSCPVTDPRTTTVRGGPIPPKLGGLIDRYVASPDAGIEEHVSTPIADRLVAAKQALTLVSHDLGRAYGRDVPRLDVELEAKEGWQCPGEPSQGPKRPDRNATTPGSRSDGVSHGRTGSGGLGRIRSLEVAMRPGSVSMRTREGMLVGVEEVAAGAQLMGSVSVE